MPDLTALQWVLASAAALMIGFSKTGVPGFGMLAVPVLAVAFGGRPSLGIMLPMLLLADLFAIAWYRRHARWDVLRSLAIWVVLGVTLGSGTLWLMSGATTGPDWPGAAIGVLVLAMLALHLWRRSRSGPACGTRTMGAHMAGLSAGFATTVSNAAGPITTLYLTSAGLDKDEFMGTSAWFYLVFNALKVPIYLMLAAVTVAPPLLTVQTLATDLALVPAIVAGAFVGKRVLPVLSQRIFEDIVIALAGAGALKLLWDFLGGLA